MLVSVLYVFQEDVQEDMLPALLLPANTTTAELFQSLATYRETELVILCQYVPEWSGCRDWTTVWLH